MPVTKRAGTIDVVEAARIRIKNTFDSGCKIYLSYSAGKDSLCLCDIIYSMILAGEIDRKQLTVTFVDEEGLYPSMVSAAERWQKKFQQIGVPFLWYCLPFKQVCTLDHLSAAESWITWDPADRDNWMREIPKGAITSHTLLQYPGQMNYQTFFDKLCTDGIRIIGVRSAESLTRLHAIGESIRNRKSGKVFPIYDWTDTDIWMYIKDHNLEFPEIYIHLYEAGVKKPNLRLSAFFGDMTTQGLRWIAETDNDLWQRIERRMPNAYLVMLYWDSEMFSRSSRKRKELEKEQAQKDYREACKDLLFLHTDRYTIAPDTYQHLPSWRSLFIQSYGIAKQKHYRDMYEAILYGDPKKRRLRICWSVIYSDHALRDGGASDG